MNEDWKHVRIAAYPAVEKYYPINDKSAEEYIEDAPALIGLIYERVKIELALISDPEVQRDLRLRTAHYIFSRIIRLGVFLKRRHKSYDTVSFDDTYRDQLRAWLQVDDELFARIFYLARRIAEYVTRDGGELSGSKIKLVRRFAKLHSHNCRFCGAALNFDAAIAVDNGFEVEHLFAQALGGTNYRTNLAAACNRCNKLKADRLSFVDFYFESFGIVTEDKDQVRPEGFPHVVLALLMKQGGQCLHCQREFYLSAAESIILARREIDDYYHFRNCYLACRPCSDKLELDGIEVAVPVPKTR